MKVIYESPSTRIIKLSQNPAICQASKPQFVNPVNEDTSPNYDGPDWK